MMISERADNSFLFQKEELNRENKECFSYTLEGYLEYLHECGIKTLTAEQIKKQLDETGTAIVAHKFLDGIRISRIDGDTDTYRTWTTNNIESPHFLSKKFGGKTIIFR